MSPLRGEALRFLLAGAANTAATYAAYLALLPLIGYTLAYSIAYVAGIGVSYVLNTRYVFRTTGSTRKFAIYPLVYLVQYTAGLTVLRTAVSLGTPERLALLASIGVSVPLTFLLSRLVLKHDTERTTN